MLQIQGFDLNDKNITFGQMGNCDYSSCNDQIFSYGSGFITNRRTCLKRNLPNNQVKVLSVTREEDAFHIDKKSKRSDSKGCEQQIEVYAVPPFQSTNYQYQPTIPNKMSLQHLLNSNEAIPFENVENKECKEQTCKHGINSLKVVNDYKIIVSKEDKTITYFSRAHLLKLDPSTKRNLVKYIKSDEGVLKIKKSKNKSQCDCFEVLKKFNESSKKKIIKNKCAFFICEEEVARNFSELYDLLQKDEKNEK